MKVKEKRYIKPYGDTMGDGAVQLSFTLPGVSGELAVEVAKGLALKMGIDDVYVSSAVDIGSNMTFIVLFGKVKHDIDITKITITDRGDEEIPGMKAIDRLIGENLERKIVVVGGCIGDDAHTVGIDAIMNMKGFAGDYGLERYKNIEAVNLGAQVTAKEILDEAVSLKADAVLVSQVVTQKDVHIENLSELIDLFDAMSISNKHLNKPLLIVGGPRITERVAAELGFDRGYGKDTIPSHVAYFIYKKLIDRESAKKKV